MMTTITEQAEQEYNRMNPNDTSTVAGRLANAELQLQRSMYDVKHSDTRAEQQVHIHEVESLSARIMELYAELQESAE